mgnify:CR=1 FL=1
MQLKLTCFTDLEVERGFMIFGQYQTKTAIVYFDVLICTRYLAKESNSSFFSSQLFSDSITIRHLKL